MMTLEQVSDELRRPWNQTSAFAWCAQLADAIDHYLSQPHPVAQVEAGRDFGGAPPRWYTRQEIEHCLQRMSYSEAVIAELAPWFHRHIKSSFDKGYNMALGHAAPTNPTGHRVVPEPHTNDNYEQDEDGCVDVYSEGHKDGWNSCREAMLAAAPDAGGV